MKNIKWSGKDYLRLLPLLIIAILIIISVIDQNEIEKEIEENEYETVCKISEISKNRNATHIKYYYFYNGEKYTSSEIDNSVSQQYSFRFFKVKISNKKPNFSRIQLNEEIGDTTKILNAGFKHIVKNKAEYNYNNNSYEMIKSDYGFE
ncbi:MULTISPECIES: hypothetical protein [Flavobacterium]|uniref:hypothetical protein n=1 Tax=Flavobacterium TaxID=237 RepID=UPI001FCB6C7F|nr:MULTISPECIES: hypothetical protein [Flavobacterium]UOK41601.1 hypothetical protein LZF87_09790 [Flavobacterium enshiense]